MAAAYGLHLLDIIIIDPFSALRLRASNKAGERCSKIRLVGRRHRHDGLIEVIAVVLGANLLGVKSSYRPPTQFLRNSYLRSVRYPRSVRIGRTRERKENRG